MTRTESTRVAWLRASFATEEAIYGVLLVAGMIIVAGGENANSWRVFWTVLVTVIVFWAAHVYAGTVANHGFDRDRVLSLRASFHEALDRSFGLLGSATIPSIILLIGAAQIIDDVVAIWLALWSGVLVLWVLGWIAFTKRGSSLAMRIAGAFMTAGFGLLMIALKVMTH